MLSLVFICRIIALLAWLEGLSFASVRCDPRWAAQTPRQP
ncbi:hypothetical protein HNQ50_004141 [Silvimonas terrae]|uniref:Uncharacterized protein n=1 Tax=Silvimonas terrae TaxID=300266 RepID=A0A840RLB1_9NEIS|nr:hypothetical protein [Silvimonas terrae]